MWVCVCVCGGGGGGGVSTLLSWQHGGVGCGPHDGSEGIPQGPKGHDQTVQRATLLPTSRRQTERYAYVKIY